MESEQRAILESFAIMIGQLSAPAILLDTNLVALAHNKALEKLIGVDVGVGERKRSELKIPEADILRQLKGDQVALKRRARQCIASRVPVQVQPSNERRGDCVQPSIGRCFRPISSSSGQVLGLWIDYRLQGTSHHAALQQVQAKENLRAETLEREVAKRTAQLTAALEKVTRLSIVDPLTELMNRRAFDEHALTIHDLAERHGRHFAVLMCDLDFFKRVNDTYGHGAGDDILVSTAKALRRATRASDKVARFGGEEFVVLLSETELGSVEHVAARCGAMVRAIPTKDIIPKSDFSQTISIGIAIYPEHGTHIEQLLERADRALYEAKQNGRDRFEVYSESMGESQSASKSPIGQISRVLVVEPNRHRAQRYRESLKAYDLVVVGSGREALDLCARQSFDALVSDEDAAGDSGIEFLHKSATVLPMAKRILILAEADALAAMRGANSAQTDHILTRESAAHDLGQSIEHCLLRTLLATSEQRHASKPQSPTNISGATLEAFYAVIGSDRIDIDYVPIIDTLSDEIIAVHAEIESPSPYFSQTRNPSIMNIAEALESTWELGQLTRHSIALDLPSLQDAQVFLPIHPSVLADETIYQDDSDNLLFRLREKVVLSISEDDFIGNTELLYQRIARLRNLGYGLAVRSIGTGFASLSMLSALQPDYLQLDVSQLCQKENHASHRRLIECFIGFAHSEGILTIAQSVPSEDDAQFLKTLGFAFLMGRAFIGAAHQDLRCEHQPLPPAA